MSVALTQHDALLAVDVQQDFLPGGALGVPDGDRVIPVLNRYIALAQRKRLPIYASRDWHPAAHCSFEAQGGRWPAHCVAETAGAAFAAALALPGDAVVIDKATRAGAEAYSAFSGTDLDRRLRESGVLRLMIGGLATDYCVLQTTKDALALGYEVLLLTDAIRAVGAAAGDGERAIREMIAAGAVPVGYGDVHQ